MPKFTANALVSGCLICFCISVLPTLIGMAEAAEGSGQSVQILSSDERSVILELSVRSWSIDTTEINGEEFVRLDFDGANLVDRPGEPQIPYHVAILGMPVGAKVRYRVLDSESELRSNTQPAPFPTLRPEVGLPEEAEFVEKSIYTGTDAFPREIVKIDEPAFFRNQQIVRIQVAAAQFLPDKNEILKYNRILLQVEFTGGTPASFEAAATAVSEEATFERTLLNYHQARKWRRSKNQRRGLGKGRGLFENSSFYKFVISEEGIYKIDGVFLQAQGANLDDLAPDKIRLFNNGGGELPQDLNAVRPEGLVENAILVRDGGDGRFDSSDFILFYATGVAGWNYDAATQDFSHHINRYNRENVYMLSFDGPEDGKRMTETRSGTTSNQVREQFQGLYFIEEELDNPLRSGLNWFGRPFAIDGVSQSQTFNLDLPNATSSSASRLKARFASKTSGLHRFSFILNDNSVGAHQFFGSGPDRGLYLVLQSSDYATSLATGLVAGRNSLSLSYSHTQTNGQALMDWLELAYVGQLNAIENELAFTTFPEAGTQSYRISNFTTADLELFDVTNFADVRQVQEAVIAGGTLTFTDQQDPSTPKRYICLSPSKYKSVENLERIDVTDLRASGFGAEFVIITHDDFHGEALRLESLRENGNPDNRLETEVVRISDIYNNFSAGLVDPTAIRDFIKFAYDNWSPSPAYVLLLGDGDYDYKNILSRGDQNWIPTFQTDELPGAQALRLLQSRTTDSWFTYVSGTDRVMDLGIGRLPVQTINEATIAIDKIIAYETQPVRGSWRNTITLVGDDELVGSGRPSAIDDIHIFQIESLAENSIPACFDVQKIYLTEFPKVISASVGGVRKPAAQEALVRQMNKGTLIVNFIGHGNPGQWAHEVVFEDADSDRVQNAGRLIFFVAATCDWGLFDDPQVQSQAEELLLAENRGAIAIISSARLVFSFSNFRFNQFYYSNLFNLTGTSNRLGDAFVAARLMTGNIENDEKFHIYGDPTLRLAVPKYEAVITSIIPDSIVALSTINITGEIRREGQLATDFSGRSFITTFDSKRFVRYIPEAGSARTYFLPGNSIYRGAVPVQGGRFSARFIVPKDISYGGNLARVSTYFWNEETDGAGCKENIMVSSSSSTLVDNRGPEIKLYFRENENFATGDVVGENVTLVVDLADTLSGINIAGEIGHRLTLSIDPGRETCLSELYRFRGVSTIDLTDLFQFKEGDHLRGTLEIPLSFPAEVDIAGRNVKCTEPSGQERHTLVVKAWDNSNNSSTASVEVVVVHEDGLALREVMNYPNPFTQKTTFTFISNQDADVTIKIYTISGQLIQTLEYPSARSGFNMLDWDGRDRDGDLPSNGVYLYKVIARPLGDTEVGQKEVMGRMAILR